MPFSSMDHVDFLPLPPFLKLITSSQPTNPADVLSNHQANAVRETGRLAEGLRVSLLSFKSNAIVPFLSTPVES